MGRFSSPNPQRRPLTQMVGLKMMRRVRPKMSGLQKGLRMSRRRKRGPQNVLRVRRRRKKQRLLLRQQRLLLLKSLKRSLSIRLGTFPTPLSTIFCGTGLQVKLHFGSEALCRTNVRVCVWLAGVVVTLCSWLALRRSPISSPLRTP